MSDSKQEGNTSDDPTSPTKEQNNIVYRVFCPISSNKFSSGYLIGWRTNDVNCCIAGVINNATLKDLRAALQILSDDEEMSELWQYCGGTPVVLGHCTPSQSRLQQLGDEIHPTTDHGYWLTLQTSASGDFSVVKAIRSPAVIKPNSTQIVLFRQPKLGSYLAVQPFSFDIASQSFDPSKTSLFTELDFTLRKINSSKPLLQSLRVVLDVIQQPPSPPPPHSSPRGGTFKRHHISKSPSCAHLTNHSYINAVRALSSENAGMPDSWPRMVARMLAQPVLILFLCWRLMTALVLFALNLPVPEFFGGGSLKERSALMQQLDQRLTEMCRWPVMWLKTQSRWTNNARSSASYLLFWSSVVRVIVDMLFGFSVGIFLRNYAAELLVIFHQVGQMLHLDVMRENIVWVMGVPAGMKLNHSLDHCLGSMVLYGIDFWDTITTIVTTWEPFLVYVTSFTGLFGASMLFAVASDFLSVMTIHIDFVHTAFNKLYSVELKALGSLWMLFRGKKWNALRQREDHCQFDMEQLVVGTIMFTLIFFLFPTIAIYFFFFSFVKLLITCAKAWIYFFLFFFNYFPFYVMTVLVFDAGRLPGGIWFDVQQTNEAVSGKSRSRTASQQTYLIVHNSSVPLSSIFHLYKQHLTQVFRHYSPSVILKTTVYGLKYPESPSLETTQTDNLHIPTVVQFWLFLKAFLSP